MKGDYAYFPGSGPKHQRCCDCVFAMGRVVSGEAKCAKAGKMRGGLNKVKPIATQSPACKYFEEK